MIRLVLVFFLTVFLTSRPDLSLAQDQETGRIDDVEVSNRLSHLMESLDADDNSERLRAVETLRSIGNLALPALPALTRALKDDSDSVRIEVAQTLGGFGPAGKDALPALAALLDHESLDVVNTAAMAIGFIGGPDNKSAVRRLLILRRQKLEDALIYRSYLEKFPQASLSNLMELLKDENVMVREQAASVIGDMVRKRRVGAKTDEPLLSKTDVTRDDLGSPLIALLNDPSIRVRLAAAKSLASLDQKHCRLLIPTFLDAQIHNLSYYGEVELIRPVANEAIPLLIAALENEDDTTQQRIAMTIAQMPMESLPHLARAFTHESSRVRAGVAYSLGCYPFRNLNRDAASALLPFLRDEDAEVRLRSAESIAGIDVENADATVPVFIEMLQDKQSTRRLRAIKALSAIGPAARASVPILLTTLGDDQQDVRVLAAVALVSIDKSQDPVTLSTLEAALQPLDETATFQLIYLQTQAVVAAGDLGPAADQLLDRIVEIVGRPTDRNNSHLQLLSAEALVKISKSQAHLGISKLTEFVLVDKGSLRESAIEALVRQSQLAKPSVDVMLEVAKGNSGFYHEKAAVAVVKIDPENAEGWQLLHQSFEKESSLKIDRVLTELEEFDVAPHVLLADLERFLGKTHNASSLVKATTLIGNIGPGAKPAVPALTKLLTHELEAVRQAARTALMKIQSVTTHSGID